MMENDQITFLLLCSTVQGRSERDKIWSEEVTNESPPNFVGQLASRFENSYTVGAQICFVNKIPECLYEWRIKLGIINMLQIYELAWKRLMVPLLLWGYITHWEASKVTRCISIREHPHHSAQTAFLWNSKRTLGTCEPESSSAPAREALCVAEGDQKGPCCQGV
jgi:hypothetical protein